MIFRDSNPPTNSELLDWLTDQFVKSGFDRKQIIRLMLNSRTYQASYRTSDSNRDDVLYFSHQEPRLLAAEQLLDAINHVTGVNDALGALPEGTKATQLPAPDLVKLDFLRSSVNRSVRRCALASAHPNRIWVWRSSSSMVHSFIRNCATKTIASAKPWLRDAAMQRSSPNCTCWRLSRAIGH